MLDHHSFNLVGVAVSPTQSDRQSPVPRCHLQGRCTPKTPPKRHIPKANEMEIFIQRGHPGRVLHYKKKDAAPSYESHKVKEYDVARCVAVAAREQKPFTMAIQWAAYYGQEHVLMLLIDRVNPRSGRLGRTALHYAALGNWFRIAQVLLQHGATRNTFSTTATADVEDNAGRIPLTLGVVAWGDNFGDDFISLLLNHGAKATPSKTNCRTPLHAAISPTTCPKAAKTLIAHGTDVNARDHHGDTPLHLSCLHFTVSQDPDGSVSQCPLENGADPDWKNDDGDFPMHFLLDGDPHYTERDEVLLEFGADANAVNSQIALRYTCF
ncbi:ankyrin repeat-containing domain protein [Aspergillus aurantiobrunneus]